MYALASVLQQRGASRQPADQSLKLGLLARLARKPGWMLGLACDGFGFVFQFIALGHGPLVVVQPLLVCGLLFALPVGAALDHRRLRPSDWLAALAVCAGLATFLTVAQPAAGRSDVRLFVWVLLLGSDVLVTGILVAATLGRGPRVRSVLLSGAAGVIYGAAAALTKTSFHLLDHGVLRALGHWQPYVLVGVGVVGMVLAQSAFQAGSLDVSLPTMSVVDPVASVLIGAFAFDESMSSHPMALAAETAALVVMAVGTFVLARATVSREPERHAIPG